MTPRMKRWVDAAGDAGPMFVPSAILVATAALLAALAPLLPIVDPNQMIGPAFRAPDAEYLLGTDNFGRDVFARVVWGTRLALLIAVISSAVSIALGVVLGSISGYFGGWVDAFMGRLFDIFLLIPVFFLVILIIALFGSNVFYIMFAIAVTTWPRSARIMRAQVLSLKSRTFVQAALGAGAGHWHVLFRHVIPNGLPPIVTDATLLMGLAVLTEAGLSFLGLGDQNTVSWGRMIFEGQQQLRIAPWISIFPGIAMLLLVAAFNFLGNGMNQVMNPGTRAPRYRRAGRSASVQQAVVHDAPPPAQDVLLDVRDLRMHFHLGDARVRAVDGVSFSVARGGSLGIVGESGCGKSSLGFALMQTLPANGELVSGQIWFDGRRVLDARQPDAPGFSAVRWTHMSLIFQTAMNALNPVFTVRRQLFEAYRLHRPNATGREIAARIDQILDVVGIPRDRVNSYPHELSGGMRQRMMIALSLLLDPDLVIADEPTTALDVLVQDQIMGKIEELRQQMNLALILISHDLGAVAESCERIAVMYAGEIVEYAPTSVIFDNPRHPYTTGLVAALPNLRGEKRELAALPGEPFAPIGDPLGCRFAPRCAFATDLCCAQAPPRVNIASNHISACHYALTGDFAAKAAS